MDVLSQLTEFLKKHRVYKKFMKNLKEDNDMGDWIEYINEHPERAIGGAFIWAYTNEGHTFWSKIDEKWKKHLTKTKGDA